MKKIFIALLFFTVTAQSQTLNYVENYSTFANPERGYYQYTITRGATDPLTQYDALTVAQLQGYKNNGVSLILRIFSLQEFITTNTISASYLSKMATDFANMRSAGVKCILRFSYADSDDLAICPTRDVAKARMLAHITQLATVTSMNQDVISSVEAGFIGVWGEWAYSQNFGDSSISTLTATNLSDRKEVGNRILQALAPNRMVAFRTPRYQKLMLGISTPAVPIPATVAAYAPRISAHNDCFLSSDTDEETYGTGGQTIAQDKTWLENQTKSTFDGGETCTKNSYNAPYNTQYTNAVSAVAEMARFHFSYLNNGYHQDVVAPYPVLPGDHAAGLWVTTAAPTGSGSANYLEEIGKKLGYRFKLISSILSGSNVTVNLKNVGFGNVFNPRKAYLVLKNGSGTTMNKVEMSGIGGTDVRSWNAAGITTSFAPVVGWAKDMTGYVCPGTYNLFVEIPDTDNPNNPKYSVRLANDNIGSVPFWDDNTGLNNLYRSVTVTSLPTPTITGSVAGCTTIPANKQTTNSTTLLAGQTASWSITGGSGTFVGSSTNASATVNWMSLPGVITLTVTIPGGCTVTKSQTIESICDCTCLDNIVFTQAVNVKGSNAVVIVPSPTTSEACDNVINYSWNWGDGTPNTTNGDHCYTVSGTYTITIVATLYNGCTRTYTFGPISAGACPPGGGSGSRLSNIETNGDITVTPNPSKGKFNMSIPDYNGKVTVQVLDMNGRTVYRTTDQVYDNEKEVDLTAYQAGIYILKVEGENINYSQKLIKN